MKSNHKTRVTSFAKLLLFPILFLAIGINSCQTEENELVEENNSQNQNAKLQTTSINDLQTLILDESQEIKYPISIVTYNQTIDRSNDFAFTNNQDLLNFLREVNLNEVTISVKYPLIIINVANEEEESLANNSQLNDVAEEINTQNFIEFIEELKYITQLDGQLDDFIDNSPNIKIEYPYTVMIGGETIEIKDNISLEAAREIFSTFRQVDIIFPVTIINYEYDRFVVSSLLDLKGEQSLYDEEHLDNRGRFSNYKVQYPVNIITAANTSAFASEDIEFYPVDDVPEYYTVNYPINLISRSDDRIPVEINNIEEFISVVKNN
ncbi:hypothetical protein [Wenyingzhuangia sp. IMCC45574]